MKFDMSEAWRDASAMLSANREVLLVVAGIFFLLPNLLLMLNLPDVSALAVEDPQAVEGAMIAFYRELWWVLALAGLGSIVGNLALLALLRDTARPTVGQALQGGLVGLLPAIAVYILFVIGAAVPFGLLYGLAIASGVEALALLALLICIVGLLYLTIKMTMVGPVIAIEKTYNPLRVIARSWQLTRRNSLRLFLFFVLIGIVYMVISVLAGLVLGILMITLGDEVFAVLNAVLTALLSTAVAVVVVAVLAAVHRQLAGDAPQPPSHTIN